MCANRVLVLVSLGLSGCGVPALTSSDGGPVETRDAGAPPDGGSVSDAGPAVDLADLAPKPWPSLSNGVTHDVDVSLPAVLETSTLQGACDAVKNGANDRATRLRCGKWMFFYETFGTVGVPTPLLEFAQKYYATSVYGRGFERLGFIADPADTKGMPLGLAPTTGKIGSVATRAFTCAACHFARLPDGRFAVGQANDDLDYGTFIASLGAPLSLSINANDPKVHPALRQRFSTPLAQAKAMPGYTIEVALTGVSLLSALSASQPSVDDQGRFLALRTGTMDFLTKPLLEDDVWTVSRILSLWNLPDAAQRAATGLPHEMLSWNGGVRSLEDFLGGFVAIGKSVGDWPPSRLAPLAEYVRTLRPPGAAMPVDAADARLGARLFVEKGCLSCHVGSSGEGNRVFSFADIGTDPTYGGIYKPGPDGKPCCNISDDPTVVTRGVKAPRMAGVWAQKRFLHNGAVESLDQLLCLTPRSQATDVGQLASGHTMTCEGLSEAEKQLLRTYLMSL